MKLSTGAKVYIGTPAKLMPEQLSRTIANALARIPEIGEAHLPPVYVKAKIDPPAQILVVVMGKDSPSQVTKMGEIMHGVLRASSYLDFVEWRPSEPTLPTVRRTLCAGSESQVELRR
jgi:hypothetical protein